MLGSLLAVGVGVESSGVRWQFAQRSQYYIEQLVVAFRFVSYRLRYIRIIFISFRFVFCLFTFIYISFRFVFVFIHFVSFRFRFYNFVFCLSFRFRTSL